MKGAAGFPRLHLFATEGDYNVLVLDFVGPNLQELLDLCHNQFSFPAVCLLADQMILLIEELHSKGFIHRDIKPDNFLVGKSNTIYLTDFGLAKRYYDKKTKEHIPFRENKRLTGTPKFASLNAHLGYEVSRRDDLESLGYTILYLLKGKLPWENAKGSTQNKRMDEIMDKKLNLTLDRLCKGAPSEIFHYISYCKGLLFDSEPDYLLLKKEFCYGKKKAVYDWQTRGLDIRKIEGKVRSRESHKGYSPILVKYEDPEKLTEEEKILKDKKRMLRIRDIRRLIAGLPKKLRESHEPKTDHDNAEDTKGDVEEQDEEKKKNINELLDNLQYDYNPNEMVEHCEGTLERDYY